MVFLTTILLVFSPNNVLKKTSLPEKLSILGTVSEVLNSNTLGRYLNSMDWSCLNGFDNVESKLDFFSMDQIT